MKLLAVLGLVFASACTPAKPPRPPLADVLAHCREEGMAARESAPDGQKDAAARRAYEQCKLRNDVGLGGVS